MKMEDIWSANACQFFCKALVILLITVLFCLLKYFYKYN